MSYTEVWRAKWLCDGSTTPLEMAEKLEAAAVQLRQYAEAGIVLDAPVTHDYAILATDDPNVAERFDFEDEDEDDECVDEEA